MSKKDTILKMATNFLMAKIARGHECTTGNARLAIDAAIYMVKILEKETDNRDSNG